jgi:hypothetical protein
VSENLEQHIAEIKTYGYTIIENGNKDYEKHLQLVKATAQASDSSNKSLHADRAQDHLLYNLQNKDVEFVRLLSNPLVQELIGKFLNDKYYQVQDESIPNYILNYYNARSSGKFLDLHIDSLVPAHGDFTWAMQAAFVLEDMDEENGCTVVVPGSHQSGNYSDRTLAKRYPITAKAGDIAIWDSRLWHGTLDNISGRSRWVLIATFTRWWVKQSMDMTRKLPEAIYSQLSDSEKLMLGFCSIPPSDESGSIHTKKSYSELLPKVSDYYS